MCFSRSHPFILLIYFASMIYFSLLSNNPAFLLLSFLGTFLYRCISTRIISMIKKLLFYFFITAIITLITLLFSHNGKTILLFIGDNSITQEAFLHGFTKGLKVSAVVCCLCNAEKLITEDKICYLISGISPKLAVFISRFIKFLPSLKKQYHNIYNSQKNLYSSGKGLKNKLHILTKSLSALSTWVIEDSADSSDSMYARGYGLKGHTSLSFYHFEKLDILLLLIISYTIPFTFFSMKYESLNITFYPEMVYPKLSAMIILIYILWTILVVLPFLTEICEEIKWKLLKSKI